ncbi:MAG TPA: ABC transporter ATP-binding protein [Burkholderiales bacterium]|jgi:ABC-type branched-subunit amino acid transport system ATPase component|nr:ABC transporter ATP-binding protein [Burkholderiales bacterium]
MIAIRGLCKRYGGVAALSDCDLEIASPGIYGVIGPNGAGKTTLFDVITGLTEPDSGTVLLDGRRLTGLSPHRLARMGIARSFQECRVFPEFTCLENLLFGARGTHDEALRLLELVNLQGYRDEPAASLSFGQRRLLEIVATFMLKPRILLLDEPASGVNPALLDLLLEFIRRMYHERPCLYLVVEHNMEFIMALAAEIVVMHQGAVLERGSPQAVQASPRVMQAYLG